MKQKAVMLLCCLASLPVWAQTANVDALLLSAQMAYQEADGKQEQARKRLLQAEDELKQAQKHLADAQLQVQQAAQLQQQALADKAAADTVMQQATQRLRDAWQQKEGQ
jgi:biopolymer transport protein ExbB/TolQ